MNKKILLTLAASALTILALAGCSASPAADPEPSKTAVADADLRVATSSLGQIVVDGKGMTAYFFDKDIVGATTSACTAACAALWPAITSATASPVVDGVSGAVATISTPSGAKQITVNGRPIYTYTKDLKPGDTAGQGVGAVWYVMDAKGNEMKSSTSGSTY